MMIMKWPLDRRHTFTNNCIDGNIFLIFIKAVFIDDARCNKHFNVPIIMQCSWMKYVNNFMFFWQFIVGQFIHDLLFFSIFKVLLLNINVN